MSEWIFPVLSIVGGMLVCTALIALYLGNRFEKVTGDILENRRLSEQTLASYQQQISAALEAIRSRVQTLENHKKWTEEYGHDGRTNE